MCQAHRALQDMKMYPRTPGSPPGAPLIELDLKAMWLSYTLGSEGSQAEEAACTWSAQSLTRCVLPSGSHYEPIIESRGQVMTIER